MAQQEYVLNGPKTFFFPFSIRQASQVALTVQPDGTTVPIADYTVTGAAPGSIAVNVTWPDAPVDGTQTLVISRVLEAERQTEFTDDTAVSARSLNIEYDHIYQLLGDFESVLFAAYRAAPGDPVLNTANTIIAPVATRAGRFVGFDISGQFTYSSPAISSDPSQIYSDLLTMQNDPSLVIGQFVRVVGRAAAGDGGGNDYEIVAAGTGTADGGSFIDLPGSGLQARGLFPNGVNIKQFGAVGNGVIDDTASVQNAINFASRLTIPDGTFLCAGAALKSNFQIVSSSPQAALKLPDSTYDSVLSGVSIDNVKVSVNIDGNRINQSIPGTGGLTAAIFINGGSNISIIGCNIFNSIDSGISVNDCDEVLIEQNFVQDNYWHGIQAAGTNTNVVINANHVKNITNAAGIIPMGDATYVTVSNNVIENIDGTGGDCITCYSDTNKHITVVGNICRDVEEGHGIHIGGEYLTVANNVISDIANACIFVRSQSITANHVVVSGNVCKNTTTGPSSFGRDGIFIDIVSNFSVTGNTIFDGQFTGIHLNQANIGSVTGNSVLSAVGYGLWSEISGDRVIISSNTIKDTGDSGMFLEGQTQSLIDGNLVEGYGLTEAGSFGIELAGGTLNKVINNYVRAGVSSLPTQPAGFSSAATQTKVKDNWFTDGTNERIGTAASATTTIIPAEYDFIQVTGGTTIDSIDQSTSYAGREITLRFAQAITISDGVGNLQLNGNFIADGNDVLKLVEFGSNWLEVSRSTN